MNSDPSWGALTVSSGRRLLMAKLKNGMTPTSALKSLGLNTAFATFLVKYAKTSLVCTLPLYYQHLFTT